jgi:CheY-like chemotaxis protein
MDALLRRVIPAHITLRTRIQPHLPLVHGAESDLELAILNLVVNARDAIEAQGTIEVEVAFRPGPAGDTNQDRVAVQIIDTGRGMTRAIQQRIFEPFFSTKNRDEGTGLGLSIVHNTVVALGGSIEVETEPKRGTTVTLLLRPTTSGVPVSELSRGELHRGSEGRSGGTILVVDDDEAVARLVSVLLRRRGYEVLEAHTPSVALQHYLENRDWIDMAVVDIVMPQLSGPELMARIRGKRPDPPTLFLTGYCVEGDPAPAELLPSDRILFKPFTAEAFEAEVDTILAHLEERDRALLH